MCKVDWLMQRELIRTLVKRVEINQDDVNVVFRVDGTLPTPDPASPGQNSFWQDCGRVDDTALGSAFAGWKQKAFFQHAGCQEPSDQSPHLRVSNTGADALHQPMVVDMVETALDVPLDDPGVGRLPTPAVARFCSRPDRHADVLQGTMTALCGSKPVGDVPECCLENRLQKVLDRALNDAVGDGGNTQGSELPWFARLGDQLPAARAWSIPSHPQVVAKPSEEDLASLTGANTRHRSPVDPGGATAFVGGNAPPGAPQVAEVCHPVPQIAVAAVGIGPAPLVELALNAEEPSLISLIIRVHGWFLRLRTPTVSLPAFAMCSAFPNSDYYASSAP